MPAPLGPICRRLTICSLFGLVDDSFSTSCANFSAEPDKSNPTRYRWERPLDTIRSFEAAIDGGYSRQNSYCSAYLPATSGIRSVLYPVGGLLLRPYANRAPTDENDSGNFSRRGSYFTQNNNSARYPQDSYYGRPQSHMYTSASAHDLRQNLHARNDNYYDQGYNNNGGGYGNGNGSRQRYSRIQSDSQIHSHMNQMNGQNNIYPVPSNHRSYETVASGAGSSGASAEPAGYQTDPTSSDNSSIERRQSPSKSSMMMGQGYQGYSGYQNGGYPSGGYSGYNGGIPKRVSPPIQLSSGPMRQQQPPMNQMGQTQSGAPIAPTHSVISKKPIGASQPSTPTPAAPAAPEKRKSWLSKRFSRQN